MTLMRLFTCVDPSTDIQENLEWLLARLRPTAKLRWSRPDNLHLTLKFIGEFPSAQLPALKQALEQVPPPPRFDVGVRGLGFFPHAKAPRVFWAGVEAPPALTDLAIAIDQAVEPLGVQREPRPFTPHLTLARIQDRTSLEKMQKAIQALPSLEFGVFAPDRFYLYESRPGQGGSIYSKVAEFPWR